MRLAVEGLGVARGGLPVLDGVTFAVEAGRALVLRGPNGSGKTSLLRVLAGLAEPLAGRVEAPPDSIAYASHADGVKGALTVAENLRFWAALHGRPWDEGALDLWGLRALRGRPAATLSAGQSRRLGLARLSLVGRPILLLDEPTVSLDAEGVARFGAWLRDRHLAGGGIAVVATHVALGIEAPVLDVARFQADPAAHGSDAAFL